jgi:hypothetical protein
MSSKKDQLTRLMKLDNPQADEYLAHFASELQSSIEALPSNDDILEKLELLESFVYKVPEVALRVIDFVLSHPSPAIPITTLLGEFEGKHYKDLVLKCLDLLSNLRYLASDGVLERLVSLVVSQDETIAKKSKEVLRSFAKFDLNLLTKSAIGYGPQAKALEFVQRWLVHQQLENLDFVEVILQEILGSSVEGTRMETPDSISFGFARLLYADASRRGGNTSRQERLQSIRPVRIRNLLIYSFPGVSRAKWPEMAGGGRDRPFLATLQFSKNLYLACHNHAIRVAASQDFIR